MLPRLVAYLCAKVIVLIQPHKYLGLQVCTTVLLLRMSVILKQEEREERKQENKEGNEGGGREFGEECVDRWREKGREVRRRGRGKEERRKEILLNPEIQNQKM